MLTFAFVVIGFVSPATVLPCFVHESVQLKKVEHNVQNVKKSALNALSTRVSTMDFLLNMHASDVDNLRFMTCANTTELTTKTTELAENITGLKKNMDGLRARIDLYIVGMFAIAVYMKMDTDAKFGRLLFAFMLMCAHAFRYAKMFNNAMSFIHLGRCYPPRCPGAAPHSAPAGVTSAARRSPGCQSPPWRPSDLRFGLRLSIS